MRLHQLVLGRLNPCKSDLKVAGLVRRASRCANICLSGAIQTLVDSHFSASTCAGKLGTAFLATLLKVSVP